MYISLGGEKTNTLPNSFPFKAQILQHYKNQLPTKEIVENDKLDASVWGLIAT
jgi:predicted RNase H-like nuclease